MPTITVKNIPGDLYAELKEAAHLNRRSMNSEIIVCIERVLHSQRLSPEKILTRARTLRDRTHNNTITDVAFTKAKSAGRR